MPLRRVQRPVSLNARLRVLEDQLQPYEPWQITESKEQLARWLLERPEAPELWAELEAMLQEAGSFPRLLKDAEGRALLLEITESFFRLPGRQAQQPLIRSQGPWGP